MFVSCLRGHSLDVCLAWQFLAADAKGLLAWLVVKFASFKEKSALAMVACSELVDT